MASRGTARSQDVGDAGLSVPGRPPAARQRLAELLFPDVDDPLAAVRWALASVRRLLDGDVAVGDPVELRLAAGTVLDLDIVSRGRWAEAAACPSLGGDLLEGMSFDSLPGFDLWLTSERRRLRRKAAAVLREAALASLSRDPECAVEYAERLVTADPFDEKHHVVLVRAMVAARGRMMPVDTSMRASPSSGPSWGSLQRVRCGMP